MIAVQHLHRDSSGMIKGDCRKVVPAEAFEVLPVVGTEVPIHTIHEMVYDTITDVTEVLD
ncbi:MAG: hypothetical protein GY799_09965 [Desulfobulbaceae bacterium]|nr:hypothetical protein [Desulfobulbaceae bacterium]